MRREPAGLQLVQRFSVKLHVRLSFQPIKRISRNLKIVQVSQGPRCSSRSEMSDARKPAKRVLSSAISSDSTVILLQEVNKQVTAATAQAPDWPSWKCRRRLRFKVLEEFLGGSAARNAQQRSSGHTVHIFLWLTVQPPPSVVMSQYTWKPAGWCTGNTEYMPSSRWPLAYRSPQSRGREPARGTWKENAAKSTEYKMAEKRKCCSEPVKPGWKEKKIWVKVCDNLLEAI